MKELYRIFAFPGYEVLDVKIWREQFKIDVYLGRGAEKGFCHRCGEELGVERGKHTMKAEGLPVGLLKVYIHFWRNKGHCAGCKKARSEAINFLSEETPHLTKTYAEWIGVLCEISAVSRAAEFIDQDDMTVLRLDFARLRRLIQEYKIPPPKRISVDEVYARRFSKYKGESRNEKFFTVISDLNTHKVIWVSESRDKKALDQFFLLLGEERCQEIEVAAMDQHADYANSVREYCKNATIVWDRFHLAQNFEEAVNETRKELHEEQAKGSELKRLSRGKFRFMFVKKAVRRTEEEKQHIDDVLKNNEQFAKLEIIKERMLHIFDEQTEEGAKKVFEELGSWIWQAGFEPLKAWYNKLEKGWDTFKNYFKFKVTSALSEGINNVIKTLKRRAYGYKNMEYFRLKIMQVCGYLNSRYISTKNPALTLF